MTGPEPNGTNETKSVINSSLKVGLYTGSLVIGLPILVYLLFFAIFWLPAISYNWTIILIPILQFLIITLIGSYIIAQTIYLNSGLDIRTHTDSWNAALLSALGSCVWLFPLVVILECINYLWNQEFQFYPFTLLGLFLIMLVYLIIIQVLMMRAAFRHSAIPDEIANRFQKNENTDCSSRYSTRNLCILFLLLIIIPVGITFGVMRMDLIGPTSVPRSSGVFHFSPSASVEQQSASTIIITVTIPDDRINFGRTNPFIDPDKKGPRFVILYNSNDLSNQEIIDRQGLPVIIDPPEGLHYMNGSQVVLKGAMISDSNTKGHLEVIDINPSRGSIEMNNQIIDMWI